MMCVSFTETVGLIHKLREHSFTSIIIIKFIKFVWWTALRLFKLSSYENFTDC